jgi:hypothetical protein
MFDLLAVIAADPLSASAWAILLLAGGMYPVGFMLGAPCSACCNSPPVPCTCTHFANGNNQGDTYNCPETGWTIKFASGDSHVTGHFPANGNFYPFYGYGFLQIIFQARREDLPGSAFAAFCSDALIEVTGNGCEGCSYQVWLRCYGGRWTLDDDYTGDLLEGPEFTFTLKYNAEANDLNFVGCQDTQKTAAFTSDKTVLEMAYNDPAGNLFDVVTALGISITLSREKCECFTCCKNSEIDSMQCEESVAANLCPERFRGGGACGVNACKGGACCAEDGCHIAYDQQQCLEATSNTGVWKGDGTTCDPDPCS